MYGLQLILFLSVYTSALSSLILPEVRPANLDVVVSSSVNASSELILEYEIAGLGPADALRLYVGSVGARREHPLIVVVRHSQGVLSWQIPLQVRADADADGLFETTEYFSVNRTLCPTVSSKNESREDPVRVFVSLSSADPDGVAFTTVMFVQETFVLQMDAPYVAKISPSAPIYFYFQHPPDVDVALLKLTSEDDLCMTLSVQNVTCPVHDLQRNMEFEGIYQTVDEQAGVTFTREEFPLGIFIVMVVKPDDVQCRRRAVMNGLKDCVGGPCREKQVEISITAKISREEYLTATFGAIGMFVGAYVIVLMISCVLCIRKTRLPSNQEILVDDEIEVHHNHSSIEEQQPSTSSHDHIGVDFSRGEEGSSRQQHQRRQRHPSHDDIIDTISVDSSLDETDIDLLQDADYEKDVFRTKTFLYLSDLARKPPRVLAKKSALYHWNLLTIAIFYGLPVIQLMMTYQNVTNTTGNQDLCYYNFLCSHPLGILTDFNHVFSNLGYVMLGFLFMMITWRKDIMHARFVRENPGYDTRFGIPQHFGMYYAMGLALIIEGIMSGCYHVCPSHDNFQFDTAFMYTISILILLKIYQTRHPDINANAYAAFGALAFIIFIGVIGVLHGNLYFWMFFTTLHVLSCFLLSIQIYYMGRWKMDVGIFKRIWLMCLNDGRSICSGNWRGLKPMYVDRLILLLVLNGVNWGLSAYGVSTLAREGGDFASFLLAIFISNVMLYTLFYIVMKLRHCERITWQPAIYILMAIFSGSGAMFFFLSKSTTWVLTPAQSRHFNQECRLFHFYDNHDIWHFLSATGLFLSFMILLTLDDDLDTVPRDKIPVF